MTKINEITKDLSTVRGIIVIFNCITILASIVLLLFAAATHTAWWCYLITLVVEVVIAIISIWFVSAVYELSEEFRRSWIGRNQKED